MPKFVPVLLLLTISKSVLAQFEASFAGSWVDTA
jgi:hypothetical protein